jgi:hypothetical protein
MQVLSMTPHAFLKIRISSRIRIIFEKALAHYSGVQDGCFEEKTEDRKSRDTVSLL